MNTELKTRIEVAAEQAAEAFFAAVVAQFPEAEGGDLDPGSQVAFEQAAKDAVTSWVLANIEVDD